LFGGRDGELLGWSDEGAETGCFGWAGTAVGGRCVRILGLWSGVAEEVEQGISDVRIGYAV
jgi:hypothetical protein